MMKVRSSVELAVTLVPSGIQIGETLITWGFLLENPDVRTNLRAQLDRVEPPMIDVSPRNIDRIAAAAPHLGSGIAAAIGSALAPAH